MIRDLAEPRARAKTRMPALEWGLRTEPHSNAGVSPVSSSLLSFLPLPVVGATIGALQTDSDGMRDARAANPAVGTRY